MTTSIRHPQKRKSRTLRRASARTARSCPTPSRSRSTRCARCCASWPARTPVRLFSGTAPGPGAPAPVCPASPATWAATRNPAPIFPSQKMTHPRTSRTRDATARLFRLDLLFAGSNPRIPPAYTATAWFPPEPGRKATPRFREVRFHDFRPRNVSHPHPRAPRRSFPTPTPCSRVRSPNATPRAHSTPRRQVAQEWTPRGRPLVFVSPPSSWWPTDTDASLGRDLRTRQPRKRKPWEHAHGEVAQGTRSPRATRSRSIRQRPTSRPARTRGDE
mmetsp:Transcript_2728/g.10438  ORF Transcript_2728/g.10438 Transcript_2728/m.10438 type:complete len:274 (-) Transcript_2728:3-824(-)